MTTLYGSNVANGTLTSASSMSTTTGGTETSALTSHTGSNKNGEIWSQGNASLASVSAIPTTPTGNGWVFAPGAGSYAAGTWGIAITVSSAFQMSTVVAVLSKYSGGSYTSIGTGTITITSASKTAYSLTTSSLGGVTFAAGDLLHIGLWGTVTSGNMSGMNPVVYESSSATAGVAGDMAFTPPAFTPALTTTPMNSEDDLTAGDAGGWQASALASESLTISEGATIIQAFPNLIATDTFVRSNQTGWGTASDGTVWTQPVANNVIGGTTFWSISSNTGIILDGSENVMLCGTTVQAESEALARIFFTSGGSSWLGSVVRSSTNGATCYQCIHSGTTLRLYRRVSATYTSALPSFLASASVTLTSGVSYWIRFRVSGSVTPLLQAKIWQSGTQEPSPWQVSFLDASGSQITAPGLSGIYLFKGGAADGCSSFTSTASPYLSALAAEEDLTITDGGSFFTSSLASEEDVTQAETCLFGQSPLFEEDLLPTETMLSSETFLPSDLLNGVSSLPWQETTFFSFEEDLTPGTGIAALPVSPWDLFAQDGLQTGEISLFGASVLFEEDLLGVSMPVWLPIDAPNFLSEDDLSLSEQGLFDQPALLEDDLLVGDVPGWQSWPIEGLSITDSCIITTAPPSNWQRTLNLTVTSGMFMQRGVSWIEGLTGVDQLIGGTVSILPIVDSFFRPDQNGWGTASDGRDIWTHPIVNSVIGGTSRSFISVNRGRVSNSGENVLLCGESVGAENDVLILAFFTDPLLSGIGAVARSLSDGTIGYQAIVLGGSLGFYSRLDEPYTGSPQGLLASLPIALTAGSLYWIHFRVTGAVTPLLQANVWQDGTPEPANWMLSLTDTGGTPIFGADQVGIYLCTPNADFVYSFQGQQALLESLPMGAEEDLLAGEALVATPTFSKTHSLSIGESAILASLSTAGIPPGTWEEDLIAGEAFTAVMGVACAPPALSITSQAVVRQVFPAVAVEAQLASSGLLATETEQRTIQLSLAESALCYSHAAINPSLVTTPFVFAPDVIPVAESMVAQVGTPLTLYLSSTTSATTSAADQIYTISGSPTTAFDYIQVGTATAWGEFLSGGNAGAWPGLTGIGLPSARGWFLDGPLLENQQLILGLWSATLIMQAWRGTATTGSAAGTLTVDLHIRAWKYNSQVATFELLDDLAFLGASITSSLTSFTFPFLADTAEPFITGERLYLEIWGRIATNGNAASNQMIRIANLSTDSAGKTGSPSALITTPGFAPLTIAPSTWGLGVYGVSTFVAVPLTWAPSALLTLAESSTILQGAVFSDALSVQSGLLLAGAMSAQEALSPGETFQIMEGDLLKVTPLTGAETFLQTGTSSSAELLSSSSSPLIGESALPLDALSLGETFLVTCGEVLKVLPLTTLETFVQTATSLAAELLIASSALFIGENALPLDALSLGESLVWGQTGGSSDPLTCQDQISRTAGAVLLEVAPLTEADLIGEGLLFGEALSIGESIAAASIASGPNVSLLLAEEDLTLHPSISWGLLSLFSEGVSGSDGAVILQQAIFSEGVSGSDGAVILQQVIFGEALSIGESITQSLTVTTINYLDSFAGRTVSNGWGTASDGVDSWTIQSGTAANFAVASGEGTITNTGLLSIGSAQADGEILVRFQIPDASSLVQLRLRFTSGNNGYVLYLNPGLSRIFKIVAGALTNLNAVGLSGAVAGQFWWGRFQVQGTTLRASVWKDGLSEPSSFQASITDATFTSGVPALYGSGLSTSVMSYDSFTFTTALSNKMASSDGLSTIDTLLVSRGVASLEGLIGTAALLRSASPGRKYQTLGSATAIGGWESAIVGPGAVGGSQWYYLGFIYAGGVGNLVTVDPTNAYAVAVYSSPVATEFSIKSIVAGPDNNVYCATAGTAHYLKFTPSTQILSDVGTVPPDPSTGAQSYLWQSCLSPYDTMIYSGSYPGADVVRLNTTTQVITNLGTADSSNQYASSIVADPNPAFPYLYIGIGSVSTKVVAYNIATATFTVLSSVASSGFAKVWLGADGNAYGTNGATSYQLSNGIATVVTTPSAAPPTAFSNGNTIGPINLGTPNPLIRVVWASDSSVHTYPFPYSGEAIAFFSLGIGPDKNIYGSTVLPGYLTTFTPSSPQNGVMMGYEIVAGEIYSLLGASGKLFMAAYGGQSALLTYDPAQGTSPIPYYPFAVTTSTPPPNPMLIPGTPDDWRPTALVYSPSDGILYAGSVGSYGHLNGPLIAWNPVAQSYTASYPFANQGVYSIALAPNVAGASGSYALVCGSITSGGGGTTPTAPNALIFTWDPLTQTLLNSYAVPGAGSVSVINNLVYTATTGYVYGITSTGFAFTFNPATGTFPTVRAFPYTISSSLYNDMEQGSDGNMWGLCDLGVFTLNGTTLAAQLIPGIAGTPNAGLAMVLDPVLGDTLYYAVNSVLGSYGPPSTIGSEYAPTCALAISDAMGTISVGIFMEVLPLSDAPALPITDSFAGRTVSNGWGAASDGMDTWSLVTGTAANIAVAGGEGTITNTGLLSIGSAQADGEILVRFQIPDASSLVQLRLRYTAGNNGYVLYLTPGLSRIFKIVGGTLTNLNAVGLSGAVAGQFWWGRFQVQGTTLRASVWKDGLSEPSAFQTSVTDATFASGVPALYGSGLSTSVMSFDSFIFAKMPQGVPLETEASSMTEPLALSAAAVVTRQTSSIEGNSPLDIFLAAAGWIPLDTSPIGDVIAWQSWGFDALTIGESFIAGRGAQPLDALTCSESVSFGEILVGQESLSVSDVAPGGLAVSWADILGVASAQASTASLIPKEGLSGVDGLLILGSEIWGEVLSLSDAEVVFPSSPPAGIFIESLQVSSALLRQEGVLLLDLLTVTDGSLILTIGGLKITVHVRDGRVTATIRDGTVTAKVRDGTIQTTVR